MPSLYCQFPFMILLMLIKFVPAISQDFRFKKLHYPMKLLLAPLILCCRAPKEIYGAVFSGRLFIKIKVLRKTKLNIM